jgi:hypothetical protein
MNLSADFDGMVGFEQPRAALSSGISCGSSRIDSAEKKDA